MIEGILTAIQKGFKKQILFSAFIFEAFTDLKYFMFTSQKEMHVLFSFLIEKGNILPKARNIELFSMLWIS